MQYADRMLDGRLREIRREKARLSGEVFLLEAEERQILGQLPEPPRDLTPGHRARIGMEPPVERLIASFVRHRVAPWALKELVPYIQAARPEVGYHTVCTITAGLARQGVIRRVRRGIYQGKQAT